MFVEIKSRLFLFKRVCHLIEWEWCEAVVAHILTPRLLPTSSERWASRRVNNWEIIRGEKYALEDDASAAHEEPHGIVEGEHQYTLRQRRVGKIYAQPQPPSSPITCRDSSALTLPSQGFG